MEEALKWWESLSMNAKIKTEKFFGYYGHDVGINQDDVFYFYQNRLSDDWYEKDKHIENKEDIDKKVLKYLHNEYNEWENNYEDTPNTEYLNFEQWVYRLI